MGHIAHWRKQFKSTNTYEYVITLIRRRKTYYLLFENQIVPYFNKLKSPLAKDAWCQVWIKVAQWFLRRRHLNFVNVFSLFRNYLPLQKGCGFCSLEETWIPFSQGCLVENGPVVWRRRWKCVKITDRQSVRQTDRRRTPGYQKRSH